MLLFSSIHFRYGKWRHQHLWKVKLWKHQHLWKVKTNSFSMISLQPYKWQHIQKEIYEVPKGFFSFCLQEGICKEIIRNAGTNLFFKGIGRWLQKDTKTIEKSNYMECEWKTTLYKTLQHVRKWNIVISSTQRSFLKWCDH